MIGVDPWAEQQYPLLHDPTEQGFELEHPEYVHKIPPETACPKNNFWLISIKRTLTCNMTLLTQTKLLLEAKNQPRLAVTFNPNMSTKIYTFWREQGREGSRVATIEQTEIFIFLIYCLKKLKTFFPISF